MEGEWYASKCINKLNISTQIKEKGEDKNKFFKRFPTGTSSFLSHQVLWSGYGFEHLQVTTLRLLPYTPQVSRKLLVQHLRVSVKPSPYKHRVLSILITLFTNLSLGLLL